MSFCNGINFFNAAFHDESEGKLVVPSEGTSGKIVASAGALGSGQDCPETRNFDMVDQDPSDNVTTLYLLNPATGQTAQDTTSNTANIPGSTLLANGSDNTLLDAFMDPVLGCTPSRRPTWPTTTCRPVPRRWTNCCRPRTSRRSRRWCPRTTRWC